MMSRNGNAVFLTLNRKVEIISQLFHLPMIFT